MKTTKEGQFVRFHTPYPDENPKQLYILIEVVDYEDGRPPKALILALNTGLSFPPINSVLLEDLELAEVDTADLVGYRAVIRDDSGKKIAGRIIQVDKKKLFVELTKEIASVNTNLVVTLKDHSGVYHRGRLAVLF
jgi:hypothetical protein